MSVNIFFASSWQGQAPGLNKGLNSRTTRLNSLSQGLSNLASTKQIYGNGADNMKAYISEVHLNLIEALITAVTTFQTASAVYWNGYNQVDSSGNFKLINEDFKSHVQDTKNAIHHMDGFENHIRQVASSVNHIVSLGDAGAGAIANVRHDLEDMQRIAREQADRWSHYENCDPGLNQVEEMIATIKGLLNEIGNISVGRSYTKGGFFNLSGYASLSNLSAQMGAYNQKNSGAITDWMNQLDSKTKKVQAGGSTNAYLDLYKEVEKLLKPLKGGKSDNIKRFEMLLKAYPENVVKKLLGNDEFWLLAEKYLSRGQQTKLINALAKFEAFGQAVSKGRWLPKIDTLGKAYENFNKFTSPFKTYVSEGLKNSKLVKGLQNSGAAKGLGKVASVATYAQLGITFVSSGIDEYGKTGSIGKGIIGGGIETIKSIGPLEGMTLLAPLGPVGMGVGAFLGTANVVAQLINPNLYDDIKDGAYKLYDKGKEAIGKGVSQGIDTVKSACKNIQNVGKSIGNALGLPKIKLGW
ncbi:hypothetical protein RyT2_27780 [Pseudolactococcus yaeyamensis]